MVLNDICVLSAREPLIPPSASHTVSAWGVRGGDVEAFDDLGLSFFSIASDAVFCV